MQTEIFDTASNGESFHQEVDLKKDALEKLKTALFAYLDVARHELDEVLEAFGKRSAYGLVTLLTGTLGVAWASVLAGVYLATVIGWIASAAILTGVFAFGAVVAYFAAKKNAKKAAEAVKEIGNTDLSAAVDRSQEELEEAVSLVVKEFLHDARPDRVIKKAVSSNPNSAVVGSLLAGALFGYSQLRRKDN